MRISLQVVKNHVLNKMDSVVLTIESQQYIFNVCESYQRYIKEHGLRFQTNSKIFLTRMDSECVSGLFGLVLTMVHHKAALNTKVYGPKGLVQFFQQSLFLFWFNLLYFSFYELSSLSLFKGLNNQDIIDSITSNLNIVQTYQYYQSINSQSINHINDASKHIINQTHHIINGQQIGGTTQSINGNKQQIDDITKQIDGTYYQDDLITIYYIINKYQDKECISYIVHTKPQMGKVQIDKVNKLQIPKHLINTVLNSPQPLLINDQYVSAQDIVDQVYPSNVIIILDCPSLDVLHQLTQSQLLLSYSQNHISPSFLLNSIVHIDSTIIHTHQYQNFINMFQSTHYISNNYIQLQTQQSNQSQQSLSQINFNPPYRHDIFQNELATLFPELFNEGFPKYLLPFYVEMIHLQVKVQMNIKYFENQIWPQKNSGYKLISRNEQEDEKINKKNEKWIQKYQRYKEIGQLDQQQQQQCRVIFTGTGSMIPSTYRNVSGVVIELEGLSVMCDCGEGTMNQLANSLKSVSEFISCLKRIKVIWLSHIHCDHTLGTTIFIKRREEYLRQLNQFDPVFDTPYLLYPYNAHPFFHFSSSLDPFNANVIFIQSLIPSQSKSYYSDKNEYYLHDDIHALCHSFQPTNDLNLLSFQSLLQSNNILKFLPIPVDHCPQSFAVALEQQQQHDTFKICYSGDTRPCQSIIQNTFNYDILIHECTYNDDKQVQAIQNQHSTVSEVIQIAIQNKIKYLYLTHFSQRYQKTFLYKTQNNLFKQYYKNNTLLAYDNMIIHHANRQKAIFLKRILKYLEQSN